MRNISLPSLEEGSVMNFLASIRNNPIAGIGPEVWLTAVEEVGRLFGINVPEMPESDFVITEETPVQGFKFIVVLFLVIKFSVGLKSRIEDYVGRVPPELKSLAGKTFVSQRAAARGKWIAQARRNYQGDPETGYLFDWLLNSFRVADQLARSK